jgi:hypothetical protein
VVEFIDGEVRRVPEEEERVYDLGYRLEGGE